MIVTLVVDTNKGVERTPLGEFGHYKVVLSLTSLNLACVLKICTAAIGVINGSAIENAYSVSLLFKNKGY